nr:type II methionyl aminopeptidase [Candidatus Woesearchaeota archaeon]
MEDWNKAGKIAANALDYGKSLVKVDASILEIVKKIEDKIIKEKGDLAFPVNISINNVAAHHTADFNDQDLFKKGDLVKLDVGVNVNGAIGDNALTVDLGDNKKLLEASKKALENALKIIAIGVEARKIGKEIQETIQSFGFSPIQNLSGHKIERYKLHAGLTIPNYDNGDKNKLSKGMIIAIEPFATNGEGKVIEGKLSGIYRLENKKQSRNLTARKIVEFVDKKYNGLPFSKREIFEKFGNSNFYLRMLENEKIFYQYPELVEKSKGLVSQFENTVLVEEKIKILTSQSN